MFEKIVPCIGVVGAMLPTACSGAPICGLPSICPRFVAKFFTYSLLVTSVVNSDWRTFAYSVRHLNAASVMDFNFFYRFCIPSTKFWEEAACCIRVRVILTMLKRLSSVLFSSISGAHADGS